ncbi:hypothetical protein G9P44_002201 [Scheffersomyces stipitis]|nr:hypothetical protein G9P44_002201 [Scheffersomyces stipitis]
MASIEQEDLFSVPDNDEDMMDENDDGEDMNSGNYGVDDDDLENNTNENEEDDEEGDGEDDEPDGDGEDEDGEEGEDADEDEDEDNEDNEENEDEENDNDNEDEEDDDEEEDEDEEMNAEEDDEEDEDAKFMDARETNDGNDDSQPSSVMPVSEPVVDGLKEDDGDVLMAQDDAEKEADITRKEAGDKADGDDSKTENEETQKEKSEESESNENEEIDNQTFRERVISKAKIATQFDITPSVAIPYTSQCHSMAFTEGPKWILTGGEDGFIRKYDFIASIQGKSPLTMAQKHNLVDSLTKAGVICSYWENEQPWTRKELMKSNPKLKVSDFSTGSVSYEPKPNPVYSLDVERNGYWCLSGLLSGGISLYTMRYSEGNIHHYFKHGTRKDNSKGHSDAVSVLRLNTDQDKFLSGSWDKTIREWDLNSGKCTAKFTGSSGQISNVQYRPLGLTDLSLDIVEEETNDNNNENGNKVKAEEEDDVDSLFGDSDEEPGKEGERKQEESKDSSNSKPTFNTTKSTNKTYKNDDIFMSSSIDGTVNIWDARVSAPVLRLGVSEGVPPYCMSSTWSNCGEYIYAGRRNSSVEEFSIRMPHKRAKTGHNKDTMIPNVSKLLQFPKISGPVSAISTMPNSNFLLCGSYDNIRLYDLTLYDELSNASINKNKQATPFLIVPGHHGGILSCLHVDDTGRFMISASGNRGWGHSSYTDTVLIYEIDFEGI